MADRIWLGYGFKRNCAHFLSSYVDTASDADHRDGMIRVSGVMWYTNLEVRKRHEQMPLYKAYSEEEFPKLDTWDAINIDKSCDIPRDYDGIMAVPITFMDKYSPEQFEIVGVFNHGCDSEFDLAKPVLRGQELYTRIAIRRRKPQSVKSVQDEVSRIQ